MADLKTLTLAGPAGGYYVTDSRLAYASIITVKREGQRNYPVEAIPSGTAANCYYDASLGRIYVSTDLPFNYSALDEFGARIIEYMHIIYTAGDGTIIDTPPITP